MNNPQFQIRPAESEDLPEILRIYAAARGFMKSHGNETQWGDSYPLVSMLEDDIAKGQLYVGQTGRELHGVFALICGEDPTYGVIDGAWMDSTEYRTIHRVASDGTVRGLLARAVSFAKGQCPHLRIDTHRDNYPMQNAILKEGFSRCGIIYLEDGSPRIAYELPR